MLEQYPNVKTIDGRRAVVRNGCLPERETGSAVGPVPVQVPKVRDRSGCGIKFNSTIVPLYVRKSPSVSSLLPWRYLRGVSTGDMGDALLAFHDFPAEHWQHVRTTNPIESTFATGRHRTGRTRNCLSRATFLAMAFKLIEAARTDLEEDLLRRQDRTASEGYALQARHSGDREHTGPPNAGRLIMLPDTRTPS